MNVIAFIIAFASNAPAQILATVGDSPITVEEFNKRFAEVKARDPRPPAPDEFLEDLVRFKMGLLEAGRQKLAEDPVVRERFDQILYNSLLEKELGPKIERLTFKESDLRSYYNDNPELRLAHVLINVKSDAKPEDREVARQRALINLGEIRAGKRPFEEYVKLYSDDPFTKDNGGDLSYQSRTTLLPEVYDIAVNMKPGEIKGLIESRDGYHILKLIDRRPFDLADKRQMRTALLDQARVKIFNTYFAGLKKQKAYRVDVNKEALRSLR